MSQGAMRTHAIIALEGNYWCELKGDSAVVNFITDEQIREMTNTADSYPPAAEGGGGGYELLFELRLHRIITWALEHGYLDVLDPMQRCAIRERVKLGEQP